MNIMEMYTMCSQELERKEILDRIIRRELSQVKAADMLGLTDRHVRELEL